MLQKLFSGILILLLFSACVPDSNTPAGVEPLPTNTTVSDTVAPEPQPSATAQPTLPPVTDTPVTAGTLRGAVCYPSESIPAMNAFFQNTATGELTTLAIAENQAAYELVLPAGQYIAFAYTAANPTMGGAYTQAVPCGLSVDCTDHSLLSVDIQAGATFEGADLCDWYAPEALPVNPTLAEPADAAASGLVLYTPASGLWQVQDDARAAWIFPQTGAEAISDDGNRLLFVKDDDIWLAEGATHEVRNLTNTPDRFEFDPLWWPANPDVVVFGSVSAEEGLGPSAGFLTVIGLDGSGYRVLAEQSAMTLWALSPDGQTIAVDSGDQAWFYRTDGSKEPFEPGVYGLQDVRRFGSPSYSPDGTRLAWWLGLGNPASSTWRIALVVFDLPGRTYQTLYEYSPVGMGGWPSNPVWNNSGQWLSAIALGDMGRATLWAFSLDGQQINLGNSAYPVWSPDGTRLVFIEWTSGSFEEGKVKLLTISDGSVQALTLQPGRIPFAWLVKP